MYSVHISCMLILIFLLVLYLTERKKEKETQKLFSLILIIAGLEILFEALSAYVAYHVETVSTIFYKSCIRTYLTLVLTYFYLNYRYMSAFIREETGTEKGGFAFVHVMQIILYAGIFLLPLEVKKNFTQKAVSYGPGVWMGFVGASFYLFVIFSNYCALLKKVQKEKILPLVLGTGCNMIACFGYMCFLRAGFLVSGMLAVSIGMFRSLCACEKGDKMQQTAAELYESIADAQTPETEIEKEKEEASVGIRFETKDALALIVDDSQMNRKVLKNLLKKKKLQVDEAADGKECLEMLKNNSYDLIFMDHLMPEMDGLETFEEMKRKHLCENSKVAIMTANTSSMSEQDYLNMGFDSYALKPIVPDRLNEMVYDLLDKSKIINIEDEQYSLKKEGFVATETSRTQAENQGENKKVSSWDEMPMVDGLDYTYAALHFKDTDELCDTVRFLLGIMRLDMKQLKEYYENIVHRGEWDEFQTKVHSMKNSAMTIGIVPLAGLAKTLEDAARQKDEDVTAALFPVFEQKWEEYRILLLGKFGENQTEKQKEDPEKTRFLCYRLKEGAMQMDIDILDKVMEEMDTYAWSGSKEEKIQEIRMAVMNFNIEYLLDDATYEDILKCEKNS